MTADEIYDAWRPGSSPWTPWVKPVLFSFLPKEELAFPVHTPPMRPWNVRLEQSTAIVADLPGAEGVWTGIALAKAGYRPVPIYNACPFAAYPSDALPPVPVNTPRKKPATAVDVESIMQALSQAALALQESAIADNAPPAFLVDKDRRGHGPPKHGWFDNRSFLATTDFPSAEVLRQRGIRRVVLVRVNSDVDRDLKAVLTAWQNAGLEIGYQGAWLDWHPVPTRIRSAWLLRRHWDRVVVLLGYPSREKGAFGEGMRSSSG